MSKPSNIDIRVHKLKRDARGLMYVAGMVCVLMSLMVLVKGKDIVTNSPPGDRIGASALVLPFVGWVLKRTVLQSREEQRLFAMVEQFAYAMVSGIIWWGAAQMRQLHNYRMSVLASRLALVPWFFSGFPFGFVFGFRAILHLRHPEIKELFAVR